MPIFGGGHTKRLPESHFITELLPCNIVLTVVGGALRNTMACSLLFLEQGLIDRQRLPYAGCPGKANRKRGHRSTHVSCKKQRHHQVQGSATVNLESSSEAQMLSSHTHRLLLRSGHRLLPPEGVEIGKRMEISIHITIQ